MASGTNKPRAHDCEEPGLLFHEFVLLLGLIAKQAMTCEADTVAGVIECFFVEKLTFKEPPENHRNIMKFDGMMRKAHHRAKQSKKSIPEPVYTEVRQIQDGESSYEEFYTDDEECESLDSDLDDE